MWRSQQQTCGQGERRHCESSQKPSTTNVLISAMHTHGLQAHGRSTVDTRPTTKGNTACQPRLLEHNNKHEGCGASTHCNAKAQAINNECVHLDHAYFETLTCCKLIEETIMVQSPRPSATQHVSHMWRSQQQA